MPNHNDYKLDLTSLEDALRSFEASLDIINNADWFEGQSSAVKNTLTAGVIQNFEFVYELSIKMLRRRLELDSDSPESIDQLSFRETLRLAGERGLIDNVETWFGYRLLRNLTSHTYDQAKAKIACAEALPFLGDAERLMRTLKSRNEQDS